MMKNKISIITIAFNSEKTIEETIKSVVNQKYDNLEYIIIDGGSTDNTLNIINKYKKSVDVLVSEPDKGISDAFNKGIKLATGKIIGIINSDDLLNKNALIKLNEEVNNNPNYDIYYGNTIFFNKKNNYVCKPNTDLEKLKIAFLINHQSVFVRKEAYDRYGLFDLDFKYSMDFDLLSRMYFAGAKFMYVDYEFAWFRNGGVSQISALNTIEDCKKIAKRNGCTKEEIDDYYNNIIKNLKRISFIHKIGLEYVLRRIIKKQKKYSDNSNWFEE